MEPSLKNLFKNLEYKDNIWFPKTPPTKVSYPDKASDECFEIEDKSFWFTHRNRCLKAVINKFIKNLPLLDVGGGNGSVSKSLMDENIKVVMIEPYINGVMNAKKRGVKDLICASFDDLEIQKNSVPNLGFFDVIEHIKDDKKIIKQSYEFLCPGGKIFITVPAYDILWSDQDIVAGHYRRYSLRDIDNILKDAGFNVLYKTYFFSFLPIPIFFFRTIPWFIKNIFKKENRANSMQDDHYVNHKSLIWKILNKIMELELRQIEKGQKIFFGGSCLVVAYKKT